MRIIWNGFLKRAVEEYPNEACAFLFTNKPYGGEEEIWHVFPADNISETPDKSWVPSKKETAQIKRMAKDLGLVKIGNVHTHPYPNEEFSEETLQHILTPSDEDIKCACKFRDIVRIIVVTSKDSVYGFRAHDMNRKKIDVTLEELE